MACLNWVRTPQGGRTRRHHGVRLAMLGAGLFAMLLSGVSWQEGEAAYQRWALLASSMTANAFETGNAPEAALCMESAARGALARCAVNNGMALSRAGGPIAAKAGPVQASSHGGRVLMPGGASIGLALNTGGVIVIGTSDLGSTPSPARLAGLKAGDVIEAVNGQALESAQALAAMLTDRAIDMRVNRRGERFECRVQPERDVRDGQWRLGAWVRDSTAGVGTMTFYEPDRGRYGALGHAITDVDTGVLMPVATGIVYENNITGLTRGREGAPGELTGDFMNGRREIGTLESNSDFGVFGALEGAFVNPLYPEGLPAAERSQIHTGSATLLTTIDEDTIGEYRCEIVRFCGPQTPDTRSMVIRITDEALLSATGGIVQGMSGSPILQDGRIVGAVTHVMVNDPAMGYGIFIDSMLDACDGLESTYENTFAA